MNLFEDGFNTKEDQIKILNRQGLSVSQIAEKTDVSEDKVTTVINGSKTENTKNNINE